MSAPASLAILAILAKMRRVCVHRPEILQSWENMTVHPATLWPVIPPSIKSGFSSCIGLASTVMKSVDPKQVASRGPTTSLPEQEEALSRTT